MTNIAHRRRPVSLLLAWPLLIATGVYAATNQFRGVNWADKRDNFQSGVLYLSGLSSTDTYASASVVAERILGQFMSKVGSNSVRMPVNEATVDQFWGTYTGAIDVALSKGRVILCYWGKASGANPPDMDAWWDMWSTIMGKYGTHPNLHVEVFNEPSGYNKTDLLNLYDQWLRRFPGFPRNRIILDGSGLAWGVPDVGSDRRFDSCLLAVHDYTFFASSDWNQEWQWANHIKGYVGNYADRTIATEWGGPMTTGSKNGVTYQPMDYDKPATNFFEAYIRGISQQLRDWKMGSFYWPGLRDGDWYSMTNKTGTGSTIELTVPNQSGLRRLQHSWADTVPTAVAPAAAPRHDLRVEGGLGGLRLEFTAPRSGTTTVRLLDVKGRAIDAHSFSTVAGETCVRDFHRQDLKPGLYLIRIGIQGRTVAQAKLVLAR
ncbi:MAG: cellulase [Fibrobacteria bacterium]|nr:cellulase [Fibrobacteria bacterium]